MEIHASGSVTSDAVGTEREALTGQRQKAVINTLKEADLPGLAKRFVDRPPHVDDWPSIEDLCRRMRIPVQRLEVLEGAADIPLQAALVHLAGSDNPKISQAVQAGFDAGQPAGIEAVRIVVERGLFPVDGEFDDGSCLLRDVITSDHPRFPRLASARVLLETLHADPNQLFGDGAPPLAHVQTGEMYDLLVRAGAKLDADVVVKMGTDFEFVARVPVQHLARSPETVRVHKEKGLDINATSYASTTPLLHAVDENRHDVVRALVEAGADVHCSRLSETVLHVGPCGDNVELLLDYGADPLALTGSQESTLHRATDARAVELLVARIGTGWTKLRSLDGGRNSVLDTAALRGNVEVVDKLLELDEARELDRFQALTNSKSPPVVAALFPRPGDPPLTPSQLEKLEFSKRTRGWSVDTYYVVAKHGGDQAVLEELIGADARLNKVWDLGLFGSEVQAAREVAVAGGKTYSLAGLLLRDFPDDFKALQDLLERHALEITARDSAGRTLLWLAIRYNRSLEEIEYLLDQGVEIDRHGPDELTALHLAAEAGDRALCSLLIEHGADLTLTDGDGKTPADYAPSDELRSLLTPPP
jgi:ankyrin repeat protein